MDFDTVMRRTFWILEMYYWRSAKLSRGEIRANKEIRHHIDAKDTAIDRMERRGLKGFGQLIRMIEQRWPQKLCRWTPLGSLKRGTPRLFWY